MAMAGSSSWATANTMATSFQAPARHSSPRRMRPPGWSDPRVNSLTVRQTASPTAWASLWSASTTCFPPAQAIGRLRPTVRTGPTRPVLRSRIPSASRPAPAPAATRRETMCSPWSRCMTRSIPAGMWVPRMPPGWPIRPRAFITATVPLTATTPSPMARTPPASAPLWPSPAPTSSAAWSIPALTSGPTRWGATGATPRTGAPTRFPMSGMTWSSPCLAPTRSTSTPPWRAISTASPSVPGWMGARRRWPSQVESSLPTCWW